MSNFLAKLVPRSAVVVLLSLTVAAVAAFAAVSHLVNRFNANQQARGRKLYAAGVNDMNARNTSSISDALFATPDVSTKRSLTWSLSGSARPRTAPSIWL